MGSWKGGFDGKHYTLFEVYEMLSKMLPVPWVELVVVHNTAMPNIKQWQSTPGGSPQRIKNLAHYYENQRKWAAGPHAFIPPEGGVFWGTPLTETGVHSPSWNAKSWGVELAGDFNVDDPDTDPGLVIKNSAAHLVALLLRHQELSVDRIRFHKEDPKTTHKGCPGSKLSKDVFVQLVEGKLIHLTGPLLQPGAFAVSDFGRSWAKRFEGLRLKAYWDKTGYAIGYGHNNSSNVPPPVTETSEITEDEANTILDADLALQAHYLNVLVKIPLTQGQVDALILHIFQQGPGNFKRGKVFPLIKEMRFKEAADAIRDWPTQSLGLKRRRAVEAEIFKGNKPTVW